MFTVWRVSSVNQRRGFWAAGLRLSLAAFGLVVLGGGLLVLLGSTGRAEDEEEAQARKEAAERARKAATGTGTLKIEVQLPQPGDPLKVIVPNAEAKLAQEMKPYTDAIPGTTLTFEMVPIPGGEFLMGSPPNEPGREKHEGPQHRVKLEPFWMGKHEVSWEEYDTWTFKLDILRRKYYKVPPTLLDKNFADTYTRPTKPYTDMTFGMGHKGYPAICMTQLAARAYCEWLSLKTGRYYRLPTEAEWEYACRAGTTTRYSWGDDPGVADQYAWFIDNSNFEYAPIGKKKPNPWGLHDMHGNVAEWVLDEYRQDFYGQFQDQTADNPLAKLKNRYQSYTHIVRGGSWDDEVEALRSATRRASNPDWKAQDPQVPQSDWYFTDAIFVGFRLVRPFNPPKNWRETLKKNMAADRKRLQENG